MKMTPPQAPLDRSLGWLSLALGAPQLARPAQVNRLIGARDDPRSRLLQRFVGIREVAAWAGILSRPRPAGWLWARVAGDATDLALLGAAFGVKGSDPRRLAAATASVATVTAVDVFAALRTSRQTRPTDEEDHDMHVKTAITVRHPLADVFAAWENFENFPLFMNHLESVQEVGNGRSRWTAKRVAGRTLEWEAEVVTLTQNEAIEWRSVPGSDFQNTGAVRFEVAPANQGTEIHLEMEYRPPGGKLGDLAAKVLGEDPTSKAKDDLRRFKQLMETGEIVRSDSTPEGTAARRYFKQRPAQPVAPPETVAAGKGDA
jgi:uncharacterized membrane protein